MTINFNKAEFVLSATTQNAFIRDGRPQVTFAGRSNVGKSSVINRLLNRKNFARVGATPGKTSQVNYFRIDGKLYFTDLPGYGYAKVSKEERERWGRLMESYFQEPGLISLGVLIVDARHKPSADDVTMCNWFKEAGCPMLVVANKVDKLKKREVEPNLEVIRQTLELSPETPLVPFSAEKGDGKTEVLSLLSQFFLSMFRIPLPFPAGGYPHPATGVPYPTTGYPPRRNSSGAGSASGAEGNFHQILYEKIVFFSNCDTIRWNETAPCGQKAPVRKNSAEKASLRGQKGGSCCDLSG